jgi:hypothetical protein
MQLARWRFHAPLHCEIPHCEIPHCGTFDCGTFDCGTFGLRHL